MVHRDLRGTPAQHAYRCARCVDLLQLDLCYDQAVCDTATLASMRAELMSTVTTNLDHCRQINKIAEQSTVLVDTNQVAKAENIKHIDFMCR
jgi:hypothetical protein